MRPFLHAFKEGRGSLRSVLRAEIDWCSGSGIAAALVGFGWGVCVGLDWGKAAPKDTPELLFMRKCLKCGWTEYSESPGRWSSIECPRCGSRP